MNEAEATKFIGMVQDKIAKGEIPEIAAFTPDQKATLLCLARAFEGQRSREIAAKVLPVLQSPEDVQALLFGVKFFRWMQVGLVVGRFMISLPGAIIIALASSVTGIVDPRSALEWIIELAKL